MTGAVRGVVFDVDTATLNNCSKGLVKSTLEEREVFIIRGAPTITNIITGYSETTNSGPHLAQ